MLYGILVFVFQYASRRAANGEIVLRAMWGIVHPDEQKFALASKQDFSESADPSGDYENMVAAQSRVLDQLSREIARDILDLHRQRGSGAGKMDE